MDRVQFLCTIFGTKTSIPEVLPALLPHLAHLLCNLIDASVAVAVDELVGLKKLLTGRYKVDNTNHGVYISRCLQTTVW